MSENNPYGGQPGEPYGPSGPGLGPGGAGYPAGWGPQPPGPQPGWGPQPGGGPPDWSPQEPGYAFGPFAPGQPSIPYGPGPPGQPPYGPPGPPPGRRSKLPLIIGAAALALILLVVGIAVAVSRSAKPAAVNNPTSAPSIDPTAPPSPAAKALASDAVDGYLRAVAAGDVAAALAYGIKKPADDTLLDDKVVELAREQAPITAISVTPVDDPAASRVNATYRIGQQQVRESFGVEQVQGRWKLSQVVSEIDLRLVRKPSVPVIVNNKVVESDTVYVLPGRTASPRGSSI